MPLFNTKHNLFKNNFSPSTITKWNKSDYNIPNSGSIGTFRKKYSGICNTFSENNFNLYNPREVQILSCFVPA